MAAYFHSTHGTTEIPDHGLHTLILMNNNHNPNNNLVNNNGGYPESHNILLHHPLPPLHHPHNHHHQFLSPQDHHNNITLYGYPQPQQEARNITRSNQQQGLSLSLSSSQNHPPPPYGRIPPPPPPPEADVGGGGADVSGESSVLGSKYLKAAQELLEEVVHVGDEVVHHHSPNKGGGCGGGGGGGGGLAGKDAGDSPEEHEKRSRQLSTVERQEIQMKKAKLVTMLDEAEQKYREYNHQMQIIITAFEQAAGMGSAKTYTDLALKTISKQFRCLKDAIGAQIRAANKTLGEEEAGSGGPPTTTGKIEGSRLKFIDHHIRQQRALQQLGMIQNHNAWRPQRGLPERSVSVLRAWLFEHFLHPYPKDSDKIMLAKQTGLTRSQVSNWFINARVRLWKPMIEEMYMEELKEQEQKGAEEIKANSPEEKINISENQINKVSKKDQNSSSFIPIPNNNNNRLPQTQQGFTLTSSMGVEIISQGSPKRQRSNNHDFVDNNNNDNNNNGEILIKFGNPNISGGMNFVGGGELGSYSIGDITRFQAQEFSTPRFLPLNGNGNGNGNGNVNGISLSLGLPPSENHQLNHSFMSPNQNIHSSTAVFECIDIQNRKGFAAQLLPDFVA